MQRTWRIFRALLDLDAKEFLRDGGALFFTFAFPLFFVVVLSVQAGRGLEPTRVGVVAAADGAGAEELMALLARDGVLLPELTTAEPALAALRKGELKAVITLSAAGLRDGAPLEVRADPRYAAMLRLALDSARLALASERAPDFTPPFSVSVAVDPALGQGNVAFVLPGILALALLQLGLFGTATPLLRARDRGTLRHLSTTPAPRLGLLLSQLTVRLAISMVQIALLIGCSVALIRDLHFDTTQWLALFPATLGGAAMLIALGYALAGLPSSQNSGMLLTLAVNFAFLFGGAIFFDPGQSTVARAVAYAVPLTYLGDLFRQLLVGGAGLVPVWIDAMAVAGFTVLAAVLALKTFRFEMAR